MSRSVPRRAYRPMALRIKDEGGLVGDLEVVEALFDVLVKDEYRLGTVVDGFPRTKIQVRAPPPPSRRPCVRGC